MNIQNKTQRVIKFRAWGKLTKDMHNLGPTENFTVEGELESNENKVYMQYTGKLDDNGDKIFEGDIMENEDYTGSVVWDDAEARFILQSFSDGNGAMIAGVKHYSPIFGEIIGNIYENPELLENNK